MPRWLTDEDHDLIREVVLKVLKGRVNSPTRNPYPTTDGAQEIYIARIPNTGIPAKVGDVLGSAECEIYKVVQDGSDDKLEVINLHSDKNLKKTVYNIYPVSIPFSSAAPFFTIIKDKYGQFIIEAPNVVDHYVCKVPLTGIPARVGLVPGMASAEIWYRDTGTGNLTATGQFVDIHNIYPVAVAFDAAAPYFQIDLDGFASWYCEAPQVASGGGITGVPFKNVSGFTMPPGAVIRCIDAEDIGGIPYILGYRSSTQFDNFWLINGQSAVANNGTGLGSFLTDLVGFVAIGSSDTPGTLHNWGPQPNSFELAKDRLGFFPLRAGAYTIGGQRCGYFKQRFISELLGKWYGDLNQNGSASFITYAKQSPDHKFGDPGGWDPITAYDFWLQMNQKVKAGTKGKIIWYANSWVMDLTHCEVSNTQETTSGSRFSSFSQSNLTSLGFAQTAPTPIYTTPTSGYQSGIYSSP